MAGRILVELLQPIAGVGPTLSRAYLVNICQERVTLERVSCRPLIPPSPIVRTEASLAVDTGSKDPFMRSCPSSTG